MTTAKKALSLHRKLKGKITVESKIRNLRQKDIKLIYTPGVAFVCEAIYKKPSEKYNLTSKGNNVAIVTDGTRILGLGNIGPYAALPVMEGKSVLYKKFGNVNAFPICLSTTNKDQIISAVKAIEPAFGAINLEDIESPKVLEISAELEKSLSIPVFHDDRHGTAVVALAALINSLRLVKKPLSCKIILAGAGSAGYGICKLLRFAGCSNLIVVDSEGAIYKGRTEHMNRYKKEIAEATNPKRQRGTLETVMKGADVFIGVSGIKGLVSPKMIQTMGDSPVVFALTNPDPEIDPDVARRSGAKIVATGSYLYENKINNALVFPYLMRVILDKKIRRVTLGLLHAAAKAIADTVPKRQLAYSHIMPEIGNKKIQRNISQALEKF